MSLEKLSMWQTNAMCHNSRAALEHLNLQAGSTFPVPVCTVSPGLWVNKADTQ